MGGARRRPRLAQLQNVPAGTRSSAMSAQQSEACSEPGVLRKPFGPRAASAETTDSAIRALIFLESSTLRHSCRARAEEACSPVCSGVQEVPLTAEDPSKRCQLPADVAVLPGLLMPWPDCLPQLIAPIPCFEPLASGHHPRPDCRRQARAARRSGRCCARTRPCRRTPAQLRRSQPMSAVPPR